MFKQNIKTYFIFTSPHCSLKEIFFRASLKKGSWQGFNENLKIYRLLGPEIYFLAHRLKIKNPRVEKVKQIGRKKNDKIAKKPHYFGRGVNNRMLFF